MAQTLNPLASRKHQHIDASPKRVTMSMTSLRVSNEVKSALYKSAYWLSLREMIISLLGKVCCACGAKPKSVAIDHIFALGVTFSPNGIAHQPFNPRNLQPLCFACHSKKTQELDGGMNQENVRPVIEGRDHRSDIQREMMDSLFDMAKARGIPVNMTLNDWMKNVRKTRAIRKKEHEVDAVGF